MTKALSTNLTALRGPVKRDFLHLLDYLRPLTCGAKSEAALKALRWWEDLGRLVDITEADMRASERSALEGNANVKGCSWLRCVRYDRDCGKDVFFRCVGCHQARYCGVLCQKRSVGRLSLESALPFGDLLTVNRDWEEGDHEAACRTSTG